MNLAGVSFAPTGLCYSCASCALERLDSIGPAQDAQDTQVILEKYKREVKRLALSPLTAIKLHDEPVHPVRGETYT
jgi:hypothetical protein